MSKALLLLVAVTLAGLIAPGAAQAAVPAMPQPHLSALFLAAVVPVLKVFMLCSIGALCTKKGLLAPEGRRVISGLVLTVFMPALFFSQLGSGVGLKEALQLWPLHAHMVATHIVGLMLGLVLVKLVKPPQDLRNHLLVATAIGNVGNLPLVLIASLGSDPGLPFLMGTAAAGLQFVILSNMTVSFIKFPLANALLRKPKPEQQPEVLLSSDHHQPQQQQQQQRLQQQQQLLGEGVSMHVACDAAGRQASPPAEQAVQKNVIAQATGGRGLGGGDVEMQALESVSSEGPASEQQAEGLNGQGGGLGGEVFASSLSQGHKQQQQQQQQQQRDAGIKGFEGGVPYPGRGPVRSWQGGRLDTAHVSRPESSFAGANGSGSLVGSSIEGMSASNNASSASNNTSSTGNNASSASNGASSTSNSASSASNNASRASTCRQGGAPVISGYSTPGEGGSVPTGSSGSGSSGGGGSILVPPPYTSSTIPPYVDSSITSSRAAPHVLVGRSGGYWSRSAGMGDDDTASPSPTQGFAAKMTTVGLPKPGSVPLDNPAALPRSAPPAVPPPPAPAPPMVGYWSRRGVQAEPQPPQQPMQQTRMQPLMQQQQQQAPWKPQSPQQQVQGRQVPELQQSRQQLQKPHQHRASPLAPLDAPQPPSSSPPFPVDPPSSAPATPCTPLNTPSSNPLSTTTNLNAPTNTLPNKSGPAYPHESTPIANSPANQEQPLQTHPTSFAPAPTHPSQPNSIITPPSSFAPTSTANMPNRPQPPTDAPEACSSDDESVDVHVTQPLLAGDPQKQHPQNDGKLPDWMHTPRSRLQLLYTSITRTKLWQVCSSVLAGVLTPPTIACFAGVLVASIKPLQAAMFVRGGPLYLVGDIAFMVGDCTVPALMLVLGGNLAKGPGVTTMPWRCLVGATVSRLLVLPLVGTALVVGARHLGIGAGLPPMAFMVMLVSASTPTAITIHSIATVYDNRADDMAALLFWEYLLAAVTLPLLIAAYLVLVSPGAG